VTCLKKYRKEKFRPVKKRAFYYISLGICVTKTSYSHQGGIYPYIQYSQCCEYLRIEIYVQGGIGFENLFEKRLRATHIWIAKIFLKTFSKRRSPIFKVMFCESRFMSST
jgi:hypothetical protein